MGKRGFWFALFGVAVATSTVSLTEQHRGVSAVADVEILPATVQEDTLASVDLQFDPWVGDLPLQSEAEAILAGVGGRWGAVAWSVDRDLALFSVNPHELFIPASNNKLFTAAWALDELGPDYRFPTDLLLAGTIEDGVLQGDVVLRGSGDPAFGYPDFEIDPMRPLRVMAERLRERGVRVVEGGVVGDPSVFDTLTVGLGWPLDTGGGSAAYAPRVSGLPFHRNLLSIRAVAGPSGEAVIELTPDVEVVPIVSTARVGGGRGYAMRNPDQDTIRIRGGVTARNPNLFRVGVAHPALMTADALRMALLDAGIEVRGAARVAPTPEGARVIHRHFSVPLSVIIRKMNNESDNFFAEHIWKATVAHVLGEGSYHRGGAASALHFRRTSDVPFGTLFQVDGSGLSRYNRTTPEAMIRTLIHAHNAPYSRTFHASLARAGDNSGTLRRIFTSSTTVGNLHAKTGYINDVRTLSGFVTTRDGELIAFCFYYNGRGTSAARGVQTQLGELLAGYGLPELAPPVMAE